MRTRKKTVALTQLQEPAYISLVGLPANRTGFKVVRGDMESSEMPAKEGTEGNPKRKRKKKCADGLLSIYLPAGTSREDALATLELFDMEDDYEVAENDAGDLYLKRKDTDEFVSSDSVAIPLSDGMVANISQSVFTRSDIKAITGVTLSRVDFDSFFGGKEEVEAWLKKNEIDCKNIEEVDGGIIATRVDTSGVEKPIKISEGIRGYVFRSEKTDVPVRVYRSVMEQAYGNYGWGHLDFASALADPEFTEDSQDAIWILRDVLENIIIYSGLPLEERKTLVQNACSNFASFVSAMMDSLPRAAVPTASGTQQTSDRKHQEKDIMTKPNEDNKDSSVEEYVKRSDLEDIVAEAVAKALAGSKQETAVPAEATAQRQDSTEEPAGTATPAPAESALASIVSALAESNKTIAESLSALRADIKEIGDATTARRSDDIGESTVADSSASKKRGDVFSGLFGNLSA